MPSSFNLTNAATIPSCERPRSIRSRCRFLGWGTDASSSPSSKLQPPDNCHIINYFSAAEIGVEKFDFQGIHEPGRCHPEVISHQLDRLDMLAIAVPQSGEQLGVLLASVGVEPLLELV